MVTGGFRIDDLEVRAVAPKARLLRLPPHCGVSKWIGVVITLGVRDDASEVPNEPSGKDAGLSSADAQQIAQETFTERLEIENRYGFGCSALATGLRDLATFPAAREHIVDWRRGESTLWATLDERL